MNPLTGEITYDTNENKLLVFNEGWAEIDQNIMYDYQEMLEGIPIEEIQRFLRRKKLEQIENGN